MRHRCCFEGHPFPRHCYHPSFGTPFATWELGFSFRRSPSMALCLPQWETIRPMGFGVYHLVVAFGQRAAMFKSSSTCRTLENKFAQSFSAQQE
jgi:hypothetical protein